MTSLGPSNEELDDQLRHALQRRAQMMAPAQVPLTAVAARARSLRRRRVTAALTGPALVLAAVGVVTPTLLHRVDDRPGTAVEPPQFTTLSAAQDASQLPVGYLGWTHRGATPPAQLAAQARSDWAAVHAVASDDVLVAPLWANQLADGEWVYAFQAWDARLGSAASIWTVFALGPRTGGPGVIDTDVRTPLPTDHTPSVRVPAVSATLTTGQGNFAVVLGAPGTTQIAASLDGLSFQIEPDRHGVAVFPVPMEPIMSSLRERQPVTAVPSPFAAQLPDVANGTPAKPLLVPPSDDEPSPDPVLVRITAGNPSGTTYLGPLGCPCASGP